MAAALCTPDYSHCISDRNFRRNVYEPEADTFLFLEALDRERDFISALSPLCCIEIGCGNGVVITHLATLLKLQSNAIVSTFHAVDVNRVALEATALTWMKTMPGATAHFTAATDGRTDAPRLLLHHGDLFSTLPASQRFDVILFNPPYVPTSAEEFENAITSEDIISRAWCGGPLGRVVIDLFIRDLPSRLSPRGVCYIVVIRENDVEDLIGLVKRSFGQRVVQVTTVARRFTGEHLAVLKIC
jgi:release factor glutamine methyltransferase